VFGLQDADCVQGQRREIEPVSKDLYSAVGGAGTMSPWTGDTARVACRVEKEGYFMLPYVTLHNAVSLDGRLLEWGMVDMGLYYGLVGAFKEDATLAGAETLLAGAAHEGVSTDPPDAVPAEAATGDSKPLLVVPDSRGRIRMWRWILSQAYWRGGVALCSSTTPQEHLAYLERAGVERITAGSVQVDMETALSELRTRYGVERVRVDSGGTLNGVLLKLGLVDEVSLLVAPVLMGDNSSRPFYHSHVPGSADSGGHVGLRLTHLEQLEGDNLWLKYDVVR
jgi:2,5-diamino-6-(ribosylamino)-4(3H)-pyrimidinone 5'-phosphate reductase